METAALHGDVLAEILRRLPARGLAASRRVCKAWRAVVDEQQLLLRLRRLLPHSVRGLFMNYQDHANPHFFARPAATSPAAPEDSRIDGEFGFIEHENTHRWSRVLDHCNGLLLYWDCDAGSFYVCNPATRRWVRLPRRAGDHWRLWGREARSRSEDVMWKRHSFLVFDPAVSKHYQVLLASPEPELAGGNDGTWQSMEWPPSRWTCSEFSSRTGRWKERVFMREGEAAGTAGLLMENMDYTFGVRGYAAYWKRALYLHCKGEYVARLSLSNYTYRVIKSPIDRAQCYIELRTRSYIGKTENGVCFAAINNRFLLQVWILNGSQDRAEEWVLKHQSILKPRTWQIPGEYHEIKYVGPWILDEYDRGNTEINKPDWSSDDDDVIDYPDWNATREDHTEIVIFLGFHPYKEIIFLSSEGHETVAYHLDRSKVQYLGIINPSYRNHGLTESFVYTPCIRPA